MASFAVLFRTLLFISIASFFITFYAFEMKKRKFKLAKEKSILDEKNSELTKENPQVENKNQEFIEENSQQHKENSKLEELGQKQTEDGRDLRGISVQINKKNPALKQEIQKQVKKNNLEMEEKKPDLKKEFCEPKTNIMFLRTHKTGSTTMHKLFLRFAHNNQLTIAKKVYPHEITKFQQCLIYPVKPGYQNNIFAEHTLYNYKEMKATMPEGTTFLTILRDPVAQFESTYGYFSLEEVYGMNITTFADLDTSLPEWSRLKYRRRARKNGINPNAYDLGIDPKLFEDEEFILQKVQEFDRQFHLVMITDLFDESMILMKEKLCWKELIDVAYMKSRMRRPNVKVDLSSEHKMKLREKNRADQMIYDHFYQKFLRQVDAFGKEKMEEEVRKLRALMEEIDKLCVEYNKPSLSKTTKRIITTSRRVGAADHKVCRSITLKNFDQSVFEKAIKCEV